MLMLMLMLMILLVLVAAARVLSRSPGERASVNDDSFIHSFTLLLHTRVDCTITNNIKSRCCCIRARPSCWTVEVISFYQTSSLHGRRSTAVITKEEAKHVCLIRNVIDVGPIRAALTSTAPRITCHCFNHKAKSAVLRGCYELGITAITGQAPFANCRNSIADGRGDRRQERLGPGEEEAARTLRGSIPP